MSDATPVFTAPLVRFAPDIELVRGGDGRTVRGIVVPWDKPALVRDQYGPNRGVDEIYKEAHRAGVFDQWIAARGVERVKFLSHHNKLSNPLGRALVLRSDAAGQYGELRISKTVAGDESLELIRDGVLDGFSVGFSPIQDEFVGGVMYRTQAALTEISLVAFPTWDEARVTSVRSEDLSVPLAEQGAGEPPVSGGSGEPTAEPRGLNRYQTAAAVALLNITKES